MPPAAGPACCWRSPVVQLRFGVQSLLHLLCTKAGTVPVHFGDHLGPMSFLGDLLRNRFFFAGFGVEGRLLGRELLV